MSDRLPISDWVHSSIAKAAANNLNLPDSVIAYGHPAMMGLMALGIAGPGIALGWLGRLNQNKIDGLQQKKRHANIMKAFLVVSCTGAVVGTISTAMQDYDIWESPHFYSSLAFLALFSANGIYANSGFGASSDDPKKKAKGRTYHAYLGVASTVLLVVNMATGIMLLIG